MCHWDQILKCFSLFFPNNEGIKTSETVLDGLFSEWGDKGKVRYSTRYDLLSGLAERMVCVLSVSVRSEACVSAGFQSLLAAEGATA